MTDFEMSVDEALNKLAHAHATGVEEIIRLGDSMIDSQRDLANNVGRLADAHQENAAALREVAKALLAVASRTH